MSERIKIRGAMWTARAPLPWGPRPMQPDNSVTIDYFECHTPANQDLIISVYGPNSPRNYTSAPLGPIVDPGYHDQLPATDWRGNFDFYLDAAQKLETSGIKCVHFLRPDRGVAGLDWTVEDLDRELTPLFSAPRAQALMHSVCLGWEPGPKYFYDNAWWVQMCQWMARVFPNSLRLIHMVADQDSPVGGNDSGPGVQGWGWTNVAPYIHGFLAQYGGYVGMAEQNIPHGSAAFNSGYAAFKSNFAAAISDLQDRFNTGRSGFPKGSAFGPMTPLRVYAGEYAAYADYWNNYPESESVELGEIAMTAGASGFLDGGQ